MKLGLTIGVSSRVPFMDLVLEAERLGYDQVWSGESYGADAVSPIAWVLARTTRIRAGTGIMQMPARTPACAASTAMTLQLLSGNRFLCGVGPSGPLSGRRAGRIAAVTATPTSAPPPQRRGPPRPGERA